MSAAYPKPPQPRFVLAPTPAPAAPERLTVREVARALCLESEGKARELVCSGAFGEPEKDSRGHWTVNEQAVREFIARRLAPFVR